MKRLLRLFLAVMVVLQACKQKEPDPITTPTVINLTVVDENRKAIPDVIVTIEGTTGSYFGGTRKDTILVPAFKLYTDQKGFASYKAFIDSRWEVSFGLASPFDEKGPMYTLKKLEGTLYEAVIQVGVVNRVTATMKKR